MGEREKGEGGRGVSWEGEGIGSEEEVTCVS